MITKYEVLEMWYIGDTHYAIGAHCGDSGFFCLNNLSTRRKGNLRQRNWCLI